MRKTRIIGRTNCQRYDIIAIFINGIELAGSRRKIRVFN